MGIGQSLYGVSLSQGDLVFLTNFQDNPIRAGEIVVFKVEGWDIPIVHRVIMLEAHEKIMKTSNFWLKDIIVKLMIEACMKKTRPGLKRRIWAGRARGFHHMLIWPPSRWKTIPNSGMLFGYNGCICVIKTHILKWEAVLGFNYQTEKNSVEEKNRYIWNVPLSIQKETMWRNFQIVQMNDSSVKNRMIFHFHHSLYIY